MTSPRIESDGDGVLVFVKVVPGASREGIAGVLGDRLKVRVSAPPEGGQANRAVCAVIARALGLKAKQIEIASGHTNPEKVVRVIGADAAEVRTRLGG